jgi:hypothetical protein
MIILRNDNLNSSRSKRANSKDSDSDERSNSKSKKSISSESIFTLSKYLKLYVFIEDNDNIVEVSLNAPIKSEDYQLPKNLKKWKNGNLKGAFYLKNTSNTIFTNSYILNLKEDSEVHFEIDTYETIMHNSNIKFKMKQYLNNFS